MDEVLVVCKHEDLSVTPSTHVKDWVQWSVLVISTLDWGSLGLADQPGWPNM